MLPQKPTKDWWALLEDDRGDGEIREELHGALVHTLGNLTLTAYNAKLGNDAFDVKKKLLADSGMAMNREIAGHDRWGRPEIHARGHALGERIIAIWPGPDESAAAAPIDAACR